jgi:Asp-tRNA(Asn)/Glu-tRNA(Gln) amidotransferase B subunit
MHIHGSRLNSSATDLYSIAEEAGVASVKQAAEVRKKLKAGASKSRGQLDADAVVSIHKESKRGKRQRRNKKNLPSPKNKSNDEEDPPTSAISFWG